jgi:hypothetical protein
MKINLTQLSKLFSAQTRGWLDAKTWRKIFKKQDEILINLLSKYDNIHLPYVDYSVFPNPQEFIPNAINGEKNIPIKNKYSIRASVPTSFKEKINGKRK